MAAAGSARRSGGNKAKPGKAKPENQNHEHLSFHLQLLVGNNFVLREKLDHTASITVEQTSSMASPFLSSKSLLT